MTTTWHKMNALTTAAFVLKASVIQAIEVSFEKTQCILRSDGKMVKAMIMTVVMIAVVKGIIKASVGTLIRILESALLRAQAVMVAMELYSYVALEGFLSMCLDYLSDNQRQAQTV